MSQCIFCRIIQGEEPASTIYEDDRFLVIMDAYPLTEGHVLVIPKAHCERINQLKASERNKLFALGHKIVNAQKEIGLGIKGTNILLNDGKAANQTVPHVHLHLIPRNSGDLIRSLPKLLLHITGLFGLKTSRKKLNLLAKAIAAKLN